jgi:lysophospholipase L1-like esterase
MGLLDAPGYSRAQADARYISQAAADARYQTGALSPLYGFFAKEARAKAQRCNILMVMDSIGEGTGADTIANRWVDQAQANLRTKWTTGTQGPGFIPAQYAATPSGGGTFPAWTYTGTAPFNTPRGLGFKSKQLQSGTVATITKTCTSFELHFRREASLDAVTITIDGGAPITYTMSNALIAQKYTSPALTAGSHTITVTYSVNTTSFCGGYFYNGDETAGLALWDGSHSGARAVDFSTTNTDWFNHLTLVNPALMVIGLGTNDCRTSSSGYSSATYKTNMQSIITQARAKVANLPVLLMPPNKPLGTLIEPWTNYTDKLKELAAENSYVAVYDMSTRIPDLTSDPYGFLVDGVHPTALGHAMLAALATTAMSPS